RRRALPPRRDLRQPAVRPPLHPQEPEPLPGALVRALLGRPLGPAAPRPLPAAPRPERGRDRDDDPDPRPPQLPLRPRLLALPFRLFHQGGALPGGAHRARLPRDLPRRGDAEGERLHPGGRFLPPLRLAAPPARPAPPPP